MTKHEENVLLQFALTDGMVDLLQVQSVKEMKERKRLLDMNPWKPWQGTDGYWHCYLPDSNKPSNRRQLKKKELKELEDIIIEYWEGKKKDPTVEDVFRKWADDKLELREIGNATYTRYEVDFNKYFGEFGKMKIDEITEEDVEDFVHEVLVKYHPTSKAFSNYRTIMYGIFRKCRKHVDFSITDLFKDMDISKKSFKKVVREESKEVYSEEELPMVLDYLTGNLDLINLGILLMFSTGIRIGELVTLKSTDIQGNVIHVSRTETVYGKGEGRTYDVLYFPKSEAGLRDVVVPTEDVWILRKLKAMNPFGEWLFVTQSGNRMHTCSVRNRVRDMCLYLHIPEKSPHKIRKTYGSILLDNGVDKRMVINQMGHADIAVTEMHYHRNRRSIEKKTEILNSIDELQISRVKSLVKNG